MAITEHTLPTSPTHSSDVTDSAAPLHVGGEFTAIDIEVSAETLVKLLVTRQVNVMADVASAKKAPFTTRLGA
jgi:hypothetical protein